MPTPHKLDWLIERPISHRGLHNKAKGILENTSSAFAASILNGFAIECDLQLTSDGEAIVFHDHTIDRVMDGTGHVKSFSTKDLKSKQFRIGKDRVQTLGDLLDQVAGKATLVIEIKSLWNNDPTLTIRALDVLQNYKGPYCLMSFDPDIVECLRLQSPQTTRGIVADSATDPEYNALPLARRQELQNFSHIARTQPHFTSFNYAELPFPPLQKLRDNGHTVISWTIKSAEAAKAALLVSDQITFESFMP